ncbi:uncharacterized protein BKCO1_2300044 [Diplodia corticola]|uniref:Uncharacterized protein n=1 Tax=Diplodia corticola TaxID=236234 RepID=A0A1J9S356_9PEZI|nr:uncharacterized protein BKCO1_2300044 [Diplodia corticola]OJD34436.1 hypothetical protein BKCO1_2300044 [Diplodia corticola]
MDSAAAAAAAARSKRPWEEESHALPNHHPPHSHARCECSTPLDHRPPHALHQDPGSAQPWPFRPDARRESAVRQLYFADSPSPQDLQSQADAAQNNKRRRLFSPHLPRPPADSAGFRGSGEDHDDEPGCQQPPASPTMSSAHLDPRGFPPPVLPQDDSACCETSCNGLACTRRRALISDLVAEVDTLNSGFQRFVLQTNSQPRSHSLALARLGTDQALAFAVDLLRANVASLRDLTTPLPLPSGADHHSASTAAATAEIRDVMKRRFDPITNQEAPPFLSRPTSGGDRDPSRTIPPPGPYDDVRRSFQGSRDPLSPHHSPPGAYPIPTSGNAYHTRPSSPVALHNYHHPPPHRMLPSPSSLNIPAPSSILSLASSSPSLLPQPSLSSSSNAAHTAHLQDLQHQISLKTLALQTLRQEYDALLAKLDRQRTKCATLERKFEVTDVEINGLTTEKEELELRVAALEQQVDELREQRDDARRREVRTGEQYRSIVEMAGRLQGMAAEERRTWVQEREGLLGALGWNGDGGGGRGPEKVDMRGTFRHAMSSTGMDDPTRGATLLDTANLPPPIRDADQHAPPIPASAATSQVIAALRVEVAQLRSRTQTLEAAIRSICDQGTGMEEASQAIVEAGRRMKEAAREAIGGR